jgi:hypothetical protein
MMEFVAEARKVLVMSWASRFGILSSLFGLIQVLAEFQVQLPFVQAFIPAKTFMLLSLLCAVAVPIARVIKQKNLPPVQSDAS